MEKKTLDRRLAIPLIGPFLLYLTSQLTGCGSGGGGGSIAPSTQTSFTLTAPLTSANLTALELTRSTLAIDTDSRWLNQYGQFVSSIGGQTFDATASGQHWKLYRNRQWVAQSADQLRLNPGETIEWRLE